MYGQIAGHDGLPGDYTQEDLEEPELYQVVLDPSETINVYAENMQIVVDIERLAEKAKKDLADRLQNRKGVGIRKCR